MDKNNTKVLICDDSILARKNLHSIVTKMGFTKIYEVANGQDAVDLCKKEKPGIALLDIVMPIMDGVSATKHIAKVSPDTKIVIVSTGGNKDYITEAMKAGALDFLQKPVDSDLLKQVINNII